MGLRLFDEKHQQPIHQLIEDQATSSAVIYFPQTN